VTAVAVWDHQPAAQELLAARLAAGWRPTPTATRDGDVVLGYAACVWPDPGAARPGADD
jgi:hypothetical protein